MKETRLVVMLSILLAASAAVAQTATTTPSSTDSDVALLRSDVQAQKTDVIKHTMLFNDADGKAFWPVYEEYAHQQKLIGDQRISALKDYSDNFDTLTDAKADELVGRMLKFDKARSDLRTAYYPKFKKAIGSKQAAKFLQVDNQLTLIIDLQIASMVPLVQ